MKRIYSIWIIGAGQIGSRHLQALKTVKFPLTIMVIDPNQESLKITKERYDSTPSGQVSHRVDYLAKIPKKTEPVDLAIVATCSDVRSKIIVELLRSAKVKYLVLEKILFNKKRDYDLIDKLLSRKKVRAWINIPLRMMPTYKSIQKYFKNKRVSYIVTGSRFGLITNAIHYFDHISFISGLCNYEINTDNLDPGPIPSKRKGFLELNGTLTAKLKNGSNISITCHPQGNAPVVIEIHSENARYVGKEADGKAFLARADNNWRWEELEAPIPPQSQLTTVLAEKILNTGTCDLVTYNESKKIHLQMLEPLLKFLNKNSKKKYDFYPFT